MATISQVKDLNGNLHDINAATVDGHTVASNVPANAEFTDTTYSLVGAQNTTGLVKNGSAVSDVSEMTPCPIVGGVPYYSGGSGSTGLLHVSVPMSGWTGDDTNGWSQTVAAVGVTADADCNPKIDIEHVANTSKADWEAQCEAYSTFTTTGWAETGADTITLNCSEKPGADFNILVSYGGGIDVMQVTTETGTVVQENVNSPTTVPSSAVVYDLKADSDDQISSLNDSLTPINVSTIYTRDSDNTSGASAIIYKTGNVVQVSINTDLQSIASLQAKAIGHISNYHPVDTTPFVGVLVKNRSSGSSDVFAVPMSLTTNGYIVCSNIGGFGYIGAVTTSSRLIFSFTYITI